MVRKASKISQSQVFQHLPLGCFLHNNYYAEKSLYSPTYLCFYRIPKYIGLLESVFRAIVNRSRVYPPQADLPAIILAGSPAVFLVRRLCGGVAEWRACPPQADLPAGFVAGWPAGRFMAASVTGGTIYGLRITLSISCFRTYVRLFRPHLRRIKE